MLDLAYSAAIPPALLAEMERAGRRLGLPLATLERLGQDEELCRAFLRAARVGDRVRLHRLAAAAAAREAPLR